MTTHLHWLYRQGPAGLREVATGLALCGKFDLPRNELTAFPEDADCERCRARVGREVQVAAWIKIPNGWAADMNGRRLEVRSMRQGRRHVYEAKVGDQTSVRPTIAEAKEEAERMAYLQEPGK